MANRGPKSDIDRETHYLHRIQPLVIAAPWVLRVTEHKDKPGPVLIVKERFTPKDSDAANLVNKGRHLRDRGMLYGQPLRRCLPVIREMLTTVCDEGGIPLELHQYISNSPISFRGNLPLDREIGAKLSLIFKISERVLDMDRVELIAWRVERFSPEEAIYWLTRATQFGEAQNRWALAGMRIMLGGQPGDKAIQKQLEKLRR
jgi:hypothetical protein